eukprot:565119-Amphidinium_carterae.1
MHTCAHTVTPDLARARHMHTVAAFSKCEFGHLWHSQTSRVGCRARVVVPIGALQGGRYDGESQTGALCIEGTRFTFQEHYRSTLLVSSCCNVLRCKGCRHLSSGALPQWGHTNAINIIALSSYCPSTNYMNQIGYTYNYESCDAKTPGQNLGLEGPPELAEKMERQNKLLKNSAK